MTKWEISNSNVKLIQDYFGNGQNLCQLNAHNFKSLFGNLFFSPMQFNNLQLPQIWQQINKVFMIVTGVLIKTSQVVFVVVVFFYFRITNKKISFLQEPISRSMQLHYIPVTALDWFNFRSHFPRMRLPWECHDQSQETSWNQRATGPELPFYHKRKRDRGLVWELHALTHRLLLLSVPYLTCLYDVHVWLQL